jgi:hypothetical protein
MASGDGTISVGPVTGGARVNLTNPPGRESMGRFSPDSKWLAFSSDESGRSEIYVRAFPGHPDPSASTIQISNNGGEFPMWNETGGELYYVSAGDVIFSVNTRGLASGKLLAPVRLFKACPQSQPSIRAMGGSPYIPPLDALELGWNIAVKRRKNRGIPRSADWTVDALLVQSPDLGDTGRKSRSGNLSAQAYHPGVDPLARRPRK